MLSRLASNALRVDHQRPPLRGDPRNNNQISHLGGGWGPSLPGGVRTVPSWVAGVERNENNETTGANGAGWMYNRC